jgi:hypothetical protein
MPPKTPTSVTVPTTPIINPQTGQMAFEWIKWFQGIQQSIFNLAASESSMGVTDGSDALPGHVGEFISASVQDPAFVSVANGVATDIVTMSLTAGDWDVQGQIATQSPSSGHIQHMQVWTSVVSMTRPTQLVGGFHEVGGINTTGVEEIVLPTGKVRVVLTAPATVYLSTIVDFSGTCVALGFIGARRIR